MFASFNFQETDAAGNSQRGDLAVHRSQCLDGDRMDRTGIMGLERSVEPERPGLKSQLCNLTKLA